MDDPGRWPGEDRPLIRGPCTTVAKGNASARGGHARGSGGRHEGPGGADQEFALERGDILAAIGYVASVFADNKLLKTGI